MEDAICVFVEILKNCEEQSIVRAFKIWMAEENSIPAPSDILTLVQKDRPAEKYDPPEGRKNNDFADMSDNEKDSFDSMMAQARGALGCGGDKLNNGENIKQDYKHFNRMSPNQRENSLLNLKNMRQH